MVVYKSVLRYPGGKSKFVTEISKHFPSHCKTYIEPFVGGGSVYFYAKSINLANNYIIGDLNAPLILFYMQLSLPKKHLEMVETLEKWLHKTVEEKKEIFLDLKQFGFYSAAEFYFANRVSFSGTIESGGFSPSAAQNRFTQSSITRLKQAHDGLQGTQIYHGDYKDSFDLDLDDAFIFCDPPYLTAEKLYGKNGDLHSSFDHEEFAHVVKHTKHKVLITYDDCPEIRSLFSGLEIIPWKTKYSMGKNKIGNELIIKNY